MKKLIMLTAIITGIGFISVDGNCSQPRKTSNRPFYDGYMGEKKLRDMVYESSKEHNKERFSEPKLYDSSRSKKGNNNKGEYNAKALAECAKSYYTGKYENDDE